MGRTGPWDNNDNKRPTNVYVLVRPTTPPQKEEESKATDGTGGQNNQINRQPPVDSDSRDPEELVDSECGSWLCSVCVCVCVCVVCVLFFFLLMGLVCVFATYLRHIFKINGFLLSPNVFFSPPSSFS